MDDPPTIEPKRILLTGAAGIVGCLVRPLLRERFESILLTDLQPIDDLAGGETFRQGDILDVSFIDSIMGDVDGVVHLAGLVGPDFSFDEVMGANVRGTFVLLESTRRNGVKQFVYASSHHAVGFLPRGYPIDCQTPHRPDSFYGVSKAFGETLATYFVDKHGLNILSIRIGFVGEEVIDERRLHTWCSPRDLMQLLEIGLTQKDLGYRVVYAVSDNPDGFFINDSACELGYSPQDRAIDHLANPRLIDQRPDLAKLQDRLVGGYFGANGFDGDPDRLLKPPRGRGAD